MTLCPGTLDVRDKHLNIAIAAEATLFGRFSDVQGGRVAVISFFHRAIQRGQLSQYRNDASSLILYLLLLNQATVTTEAIDYGGLGTSSKLIDLPMRRGQVQCAGGLH